MGKVLHASYSGYFPFCITKRDSVPTEDQGGTYYPIGLTLDQAISIFWRVKKWTFQDPLTPASPPFSLTRSDSSPLPEGEDGLVCVDGYRYSNVFYKDDGFDSFSQIIDFDLFYGQSIPTSMIFLQIGSLYYPRLFFNGQFSDYSNGDFGGGNTLYSTGGPYESGNFVINLLGYSISMKLYSGFAGIPYSASLNANEYWSYGGTYSTSTGEPL